MIVHLMRHAPIEFGKDLPKVKDRHITPEGRKWTQNIVNLAKSELALNPDWVVSSPLPRAKETAEIAAEAFSRQSRLVFDDCLLGEREINETYTRLRRFDKDDSVLLVSHQPLLRNLIADLLGGKIECRPLQWRDCMCPMRHISETWQRHPPLAASTAIQF